MMLLKTALACVLLALSSASAQRTAKPATNSSMQLSDGTTVESANKTTVFLGTEYNPNKCVLQFNSLQCQLDKKDDCAQLNGYPLECVNVGRQNGKDKLQCQCRANETDVCQSSVAPTTSGVMQFGDCSNNRPCVDSYGHISSTLELRICAEKIHCVKEINTTATVPAEICHTCRSCIAQNDATGAKLDDKRRFDCTKICPTEILDSIAKRNQQGVGIADDLSSGEDSASGSGSNEDGSEAPNGTASAAGDKTGSKNSAAGAPVVSAAALVGSIVVASLATALLH